MDEYKRLLVLQGALENLNSEEIPSIIMHDNIIPLTNWLIRRIEQLEKEKI